MIEMMFAIGLFVLAFSALEVLLLCSIHDMVKDVRREVGYSRDLLSLLEVKSGEED